MLCFTVACTGAAAPSNGDQNFAFLLKKPDTDGYRLSPRMGLRMPEAQVAPRPQQPPTGEVSKQKKIEWYATQLINDASAKEKAERFGDAIADYLQAADLLLLLAKGQKDYTPWKTFSDKAIACHQRVRVLIAKRKLAEEAAERAPDPTSTTSAGSA